MMLPKSWGRLLGAQEEPLHQILRRVEEARQTAAVYPPADRVLYALEATPPEAVRAVILGQDPYHEPGQAMGLAFSVARGIKLPPSLRNIYRELEADLDVAAPEHGDLTAWARQGVLLLNTVLTVEQGRANSHSAWGWQDFTDAVICATNALPQPIAFVLWGGQAQKKAALLQGASGPRKCLCAPHPSPLSAYRGFFGSRPFSQVNGFLREQGAGEIDWSL